MFKKKHAHFGAKYDNKRRAFKMYIIENHHSKMDYACMSYASTTLTRTALRKTVDRKKRQDIQRKQGEEMGKES
uniref:Uncharacterized protein n=1 Tax=Arion vulgaris TaxID=1028688 RepID=A0A0B6YBC1_9EUPU